MRKGARLLAVARFHVTDAAVLLGARHSIATLARGLVIGLAHVLFGVLARVGDPFPGILTCFLGFLLHLRVGLRARQGRLGVFLAHVLGVALQVVAFLFCHVIVGFRLSDLRIALCLRRALVPCLELGLCHLLGAFRL